MRATANVAAHRRPEGGALPSRSRTARMGRARDLGVDRRRRGGSRLPRVRRAVQPAPGDVPRVLHVRSNGRESQFGSFAPPSTSARRAAREREQLASLERALLYRRARPRRGAPPRHHGLARRAARRAREARAHRPSRSPAAEDARRAREGGRLGGSGSPSGSTTLRRDPSHPIPRPVAHRLAASLLTSTTFTLGEIADRVGYGSEAALSRASADGWARPFVVAGQANGLCPRAPERSAREASLRPGPIYARGRMSTPVAHFATLLVSCPDRKGIVAALAQLLYGHGANIVDVDQHTDTTAGSSSSASSSISPRSAPIGSRSSTGVQDVAERRDVLPPRLRRTPEEGRAFRVPLRHCSSTTSC